MVDRVETVGRGMAAQRFEIVERRDYQGFGAANAGIRLAAQSREVRPTSMPRV